MAKKVSTRELGLIMVPKIMKSEDLHYGLWKKGMEVNLANMAKAQQNYSDWMLNHIPQGVKTILDVGCGTGHLSQQLIAKGYHVEGVSPSEVLSDYVRQRLGPQYTLFQSTIEELETDHRYDLVMFSESFQYMLPTLSLPKAYQLLNPGGHVLLSDFFRTRAEGESALKGGHDLIEFYEILKTQPFSMVSDEDITPETAPNLKLVDDMITDIGEPLWNLTGFYMKSNHPWISKLFMFLFRKRIKKLHFKYFSHQRTPENFLKYKSYRTMVLQAAPKGDRE